MVSDSQVSVSVQKEQAIEAGRTPRGQPSPTPSSVSLLHAPRAPHHASRLFTCLSSLLTSIKALEVSRHLHMITRDGHGPHVRGGCYYHSAHLQMGNAQG